ncbi:hypothetical protein Q1695_013036 [Nippostrongylus brasiliensis]|nr:hypothetical protein Q1695_013036 [Nippostrongylus brasiliensis]
MRLLLLLAIVSYVSWCASVVVQYRRKNGKTVTHYIVEHLSYLSWFSSQTKCEEMSAHLGTMEDGEEARFVSEQYRKHRCGGNRCEANFWLGAQRVGNSNRFQWQFDNLPDPTAWKDGKPNDASADGYCMALYTSFDAFGDLKCVADYTEYWNVHKLKGWICTKP